MGAEAFFLRLPALSISKPKYGVAGQTRQGTCIDAEIMVSFLKVTQKVIQDCIDIIGWQQEEVKVVDITGSCTGFWRRNEEIVVVDIRQIIDLGGENLGRFGF